MKLGTINYQILFNTKYKLHYKCHNNVLNLLTNERKQNLKKKKKKVNSKIHMLGNVKKIGNKTKYTESLMLRCQTVKYKKKRSKHLRQQKYLLENEKSKPRHSEIRKKPIKTLFALLSA